MKKIVLTSLIFFSLTKLRAEESQYKINDLRLSVDSINSMIVDTENESKDITASYLGLGGSYEYNKPSGKYLSALKADGSYNINNESQSVASARINAGLSKKQGKEQFDLSLISAYKNDYTDLSYASLNGQFYADFERRQLEQIASNSEAEINPSNLKLENSENASLRFDFNNRYQRNNSSELKLGTSLAFYNIYGYYSNGVDATIERDLVQARLGYSTKVYRLWNLGFELDYGVLRESDSNSIEKKEVYNIETGAQNALLFFKRSEAQDRYVSLYLDYKGLRYSDSPDQDVFIPGIDWSFKVNSRTAFKIGISEGFIFDDGVFTGYFYPSFQLNYQSSSKSYLVINLRNDLENIMDYFFSSEQISSPLQESLTERSIARLDWNYTLRRSRLNLSASRSRRTFVGSDQFEFSNRYSANYKYIVSRKIDVLTGIKSYDLTRQVDDRLLDYNANGYLVNLSLSYLSRGNRRVRGSSGFTLDYTYGLNSDNDEDLTETQSIISLKFDLKV